MSDLREDPERDSESVMAPDPHNSLPSMKLNKKAKLLKSSRSSKEKGIATSRSFYCPHDSTRNALPPDNFFSAP